VTSILIPVLLVLIHLKMTTVEELLVHVDVTTRLSCLVSVLYDISRGENLLMANQPLLRNWSR